MRTIALAPPALAVLLAAACGSSPPPGAGPGHAGGSRCPAAEAVRFATWYEPIDLPTDDEGSVYAPVREGTPAEPHWQIVLALGESDDPWADPPAEPPPGWRVGPRTEAEVRAVAPGAVAGEAWVFAAPGAPPCRAAVASWYVERTDNGAYPYLALVARVDGCPRAPAATTWGAWVAFGGEPAGCQLATPTEHAARDGEFTEVPPGPDEEYGEYTYVFPKTSREVPAPFASVLPRHDCPPGACEPLWRIRRAGGAGAAAYDVMAAWWRPVAGEDACSWEFEEHQGIYVGPDAGPLTRAEILAPRYDFDAEEERPMPVTDHRLAGVLHDASGPRVLLTQGPGEYGAHDVTGGRAGAGHVTAWYIPFEEGRDDVVGPYCGI